MRHHPATAGLLSLIMLTALCGCGTIGRERIVKTPRSCQDQVVQIYFEPDSAQVTPEGGAVLRQAALAARDCTVDGVEVLGLADAAGAPAANLALSKRRAEAVTAALAAAGLPAGDFKLAAAGQAGAVTPQGEAQPLRRRADVVVRLSRPK
jgi:outer membrane protein OmpA-like peptidoglycan-associated protein